MLNYVEHENLRVLLRLGLWETAIFMFGQSEVKETVHDSVYVQI